MRPSSPPLRGSGWSSPEQLLPLALLSLPGTSPSTASLLLCKDPRNGSREHNVGSHDWRTAPWGRRLRRPGPAGQLALSLQEPAGGSNEKAFLKRSQLHTRRVRDGECQLATYLGDEDGLRVAHETTRGSTKPEHNDPLSRILRKAESARVRASHGASRPHATWAMRMSFAWLGDAVGWA